MRSVILFRFHKNIDVCVDRVEYLNNKNPNIDIYGVGEYIQYYSNLYDAGLKNIYTIPEKSSRWKWINGDFVIRKWFNDYGYDIDFDRLYLVEWDMLLTESITKIYPDLSDNTVGLTGYDKDINNNWFNGRHNEINYIKSSLDSKFNTNKIISNIIFPGATLPRSFIDMYSKIDLDNVANDEIRLSSVAEFSDYTIKPTGLYHETYFNCNNKISKSDINSTFNAYHSYTEQH